jgi:uncharacterized protein (TIGR02246 family)
MKQLLGRFSSAVALCALAGSLGAQAAPPQGPPPEQLPSVTLPPALDRVLRDYERAWKASDVSGLLALFTPDGFVLQPNRPPARGRAAMESVYRGQGGGPLRLRALSFATADTVGYIIGAYGYGETPTEPDQGKFTLTLRKQRDGKWLIASDMDNGSTPPRRPGGAQPQSPPPDAAGAPTPADAFWANIRSLCGQAFEGQVMESQASDSVMRRSRLVMHVASCRPGEIRIPFHVDTNRSRTWVLTRTPTGLRLKHDHRHADGTEDAVTQYGGDTNAPGSADRQEFPADAHTATVVPAARTNVWVMEVVPGMSFAYGLRRDGPDRRRFRVLFDLTKPVPAPPPAWGATP